MPICAEKRQATAHRGIDRDHMDSALRHWRPHYSNGTERAKFYLFQSLTVTFLKTCLVNLHCHWACCQYVSRYVHIYWPCERKKFCQMMLLVNKKKESRPSHFPNVSRIILGTNVFRQILSKRNLRGLSLSALTTCRPSHTLATGSLNRNVFMKEAT